MNLLAYVPLIAKAVIGINVKEEMNRNIDVIDRPFWLSGRFIGGVMTVVFGGYAVNLGMDMDVAITNVTGLANLIFDNKELLASVGLMCAGIVRGVFGIFQRK